MFYLMTKFVRTMGIALGLCAAAISAGGLTLVSWDAERGGDSSLASAQGHEATRKMIEKNFPKSTIIGVAELTDKALENADVAWLGIVFGNTSAVKPLTEAEQAALMKFIKRGGKALIFGDNDSFHPSASKAIASLMDPFKAHQEGVMFGEESFVIASPDKPPFNGKFRKVTTLKGGYSGWFDVLPKSANVLATLKPNDKPVIAVLPANAIEKGSGTVWLFGNSSDNGPGGATGGEWDALFANILAEIAENPK